METVFEYKILMVALLAGLALYTFDWFKRMRNRK
jgi:uncharacterized membrane protein